MNTVLTYNIADRAGMQLTDMTADCDMTEYDPIAAYLDGLQQAIDPGWAAHIGTPEFELGYDDGLDMRLGEDPSDDAVERRLIEVGLA